MHKLIKFFLIITLIINVFFIGKYYYETTKSKNLSNKLSSIYSKNITLKNKFNFLLSKNKDFVGWIKINNTNVNYPIVQSSNNTNYLNKDFFKSKNISGSIFLDFRNNLIKDLSSNKKNLIIYGHNMKNGTMFAQLNKFRDINFFKNNKYIYIDTQNKTYKFQIFSVYITNVSFNYIKAKFNSKKEYISFLTTVKNKSLFKFKNNLNLNNENNILTLSTCAYDYKDARLVIQAQQLNN